MAVQILQELGDAIRPEAVSLLDLLIAAVVLAVAFPVARLMERVVEKATHAIRGISSDSATLIGHGTRYLTLVALASVALNLVGVNVGWALTLALILLLLLVLTLRPLVQNAAAGFVLKSRPSFAVGDEVQLLGHLGTVLSISARTTVLRTRDGRRVHIPNTDVLDNPIVVYTAFDVRRLSVEISLDPRCDLDAVTRLLAEAAASVPEVRSEPAPRVIAASLREGALEMSVRFWFEPHVQPERSVTDAVVRAVHRVLREAGIDPLPPRLAVDMPGPMP